MRKEVALTAAAGIATGVVALLVVNSSAAPPPAEPPKSRRPVVPPPPPPPTSATPAPAPIIELDHAEPYTPTFDAPFGPYHKTRPRGLPLFIATASAGDRRVVIDAIDEQQARDLAARTFNQQFKSSPSSVEVRPLRLASARGAALEPVAAQAAGHGHGQVFVDTITHLAKTEGEGGTFAVPARNFNAACTTAAVNRRRLCTVADAPRAASKGVITAWGVFQWNRDAGRELHTLDGLGLRAPYIPTDWMPWDWTAAEEIAIPINYYAQLWALVRRRGGSALDAARGMRLWHTGPTRFRRYLAGGADRAAWAAVPPKVSETIDRHLKNAGIA